MSGDKEPIKPFISRVRSLVNVGVSTILVVGGCGEFFDVADKVVTMDCFVPYDSTERAQEISRKFLTPEKIQLLQSTGQNSFPIPRSRGIGNVLPRDMGKVMTRNRALIQMGDALDLELGCVEQLVDLSQTRAIADTLQYIQELLSTSTTKGLTVQSVLDLLDQQFATSGLDVIGAGRLNGNYAMPRRFEIAAALNRLRSSSFTQYK